MQFEVSRQSILKCISQVSGAVEKKNTIPVLQNIKIEAEAGILKLSATDMDILVTSTCLANVMAEGATTIPAQLFFDIIRKLPDNNISVNKDKQSIIEITAGKAKYNLPCIDISEFPNLSEGELAIEVLVEAEKFAKIIDKTSFAISSDETRYYLNGLYLQFITLESGQSELRAVSTDSHRLALAFSSAQANENFGVIIPKKSVVEIRKIIEGASKITINISRIKIKITADNSVMVSKLIDAEFPDYNRVLPKNNKQIALVNKKALYDAIDRVSTFATDKNRSVKLALENGKMSLQVSTNDGSFAYEELDVSYSADPIEIGFNSRYLMEVIRQVDKEELMLCCKDGASPVLVEAKDMDSVFVIMPIRI